MSPKKRRNQQKAVKNGKHPKTKPDAIKRPGKTTGVSSEEADKENDNEMETIHKRRSPKCGALDKTDVKEETPSHGSKPSLRKTPRKRKPNPLTPDDDNNSSRNDSP